MLIDKLYLLTFSNNSVVWEPNPLFNIYFVKYIYNVLIVGTQTIDTNYYPLYLKLNSLETII